MLHAPTGTDAREAELIVERDHYLEIVRKRRTLAAGSGTENGWMLFSSGAEVARKEAARIQSRITELRRYA